MIICDSFCSEFVNSSSVDINTSKNRQKGSDKDLDSCRDIETLCDYKVKGITKRVSWVLYMLCYGGGSALSS